MTEPILVVLAGRPGTGKTTLAKLLAEELGAAYLRTDAIAIPLLRGNLTDDGPEAGRAAYLIAEEVGFENLEVGVSVVIDGVNASHERRAAWRNLARWARVTMAMFETTLSDPHEHRRRVEERTAGQEGYLGPTWEAIADMAYDAWDVDLYGERCVVDMTETATGLSVALGRVGALRARTYGFVK